MKKILFTSTIIICSVLGSVSAANIARPVLDNVAAGSTIAGVEFQDNIIARAEATYYDGSRDFDLEVEYFRLPSIPDGYLYEWWLVNRDTNEYVSLGNNKNFPVLSRRDAKLTISVKRDLRNYDFHVLTLEKDDGNPEPGDHILQWSINIKVLEDSVKRGSKRFEEKNKKEVIAVFEDELQTPQQKAIMKRISGFTPLQLEKIQSKLPAITQRYNQNTNLSPANRKLLLQIISDIQKAINEIL